MGEGMTDEELAKAIAFATNITSGLVYDFARDQMRAASNEVPADVRSLFIAQLALLLRAQQSRAEKNQ